MGRFQACQHSHGLLVILQPIPSHHKAERPVQLFVSALGAGPLVPLWIDLELADLAERANTINDPCKVSDACGRGDLVLGGVRPIKRLPSSRDSHH